MGLISKQILREASFLHDIYANQPDQVRLFLAVADDYQLSALQDLVEDLLSFKFPLSAEQVTYLRPHADTLRKIGQCTSYEEVRHLALTHFTSDLLSALLAPFAGELKAQLRRISDVEDWKSLHEDSEDEVNEGEVVEKMEADEEDSNMDEEESEVEGEADESLGNEHEGEEDEEEEEEEEQEQEDQQQPEEEKGTLKGGGVQYRNVQYRNSATLRHTKTPYSCDICGKQYASPDSLRKHWREKHPRIPRPIFYK